MAKDLIRQVWGCGQSFGIDKMLKYLKVVFVG